jgi:hypothetical protein
MNEILDPLSSILNLNVFQVRKKGDSFFLTSLGLEIMELLVMKKKPPMGSNGITLRPE